MITKLRCSGCGYESPDDDPLPFRCANAGYDDVDHILRRELLETSGIDWQRVFLDPEPNPFVRYRSLLHSYNVAMSRGMTDEAFVALVRRLDAAIKSVGGTGFRETPFAPDSALKRALGHHADVWVKNETGNVSGSHKARHLFGILLWIEVARETGLLGDSALSLAIASCGNAAMGAAVVARAAAMPLDVFVPTDAHPNVVRQLQEMGAHVQPCPRDEGVPGDPCMHRFRERLAEGAIPFGVQGNENGLTLEGGLTLGYEIVSALLRAKKGIDRIFIQVGGGALASSCIQALSEAVSLGMLEKMPAVQAVQTRGAYPLARAWELLTQRPGGDSIRYAATHRSEFMWPWEEVPHSIAHGILDDETYDWLAIVEGMLSSGGAPVIVSEDDLVEANRLAREVAHVPADPTGSAGLAGVVRMVKEGTLGAGDRIAVLLTGITR